MGFILGSSQLLQGEDHGFTFPKTGIYIIEARFKIKIAWQVNSGHCYLQCHMTKRGPFTKPETRKLCLEIIIGRKLWDVRIIL